MARVHVRPSGIEFDVELAESVLEAAQRHGIRWPTVCGGLGSCSTCFAVVTEGAGKVGPILPLEHEGLARLDLPQQQDGILRLACQLTIDGDVTLVRSGVRRPKNQQ